MTGRHKIAILCLQSTHIRTEKCFTGIFQINRGGLGGSGKKKVGFKMGIKLKNAWEA